MTEKDNIYQLKLWQHLLLCASLFSNEVDATFLLLYVVTWGQMLGLPTQIVTFPGILSALFSMIVIPIMGKFGDRGNIHKRKSFLLLFSGVLQALGASFLIIACVVKVMGSSAMRLDAQNNTNCKRQNITAEMFLNSSQTTEDAGCRGMDERLDVLDLSPNQSEHTVITATLAFIAFVLIDIGYDTGSSNIRGFVMECVDPSQHSILLTIGVLMSGIGGCALALMGLIDYDGLTGDYKDRALAKAIALSIFLILSIIVSNFTTLVLGRYFVNKQKSQAVSNPDKGLGHKEIGNINDGSLFKQTEKQTLSAKIKYSSLRFIQRILNLPFHVKLLWRSNGRVLLLLSCLLCFFTSGAVMSFEVYFGNFLAQEIYHADADAPANSEAKKNFEEAMSKASLGALLFQAMFFLYTLFHEKLKKNFGHLLEFFIVSFVNILLLLSLALTKALPVFYVAALIEGIYRALLFTTPFALAAETIQMGDNFEAIKLLDVNKETQEFHSETQGGEDSSVHGYTISKVAMTIPIMYLLISAIMGPMLEATGNAASPMYFSVASSILSVCVLMLIYFVQRRGN